MLMAPVVCLDNGKHSCIVVQSNERKVFAIPMSTTLSIEEYGVHSFNNRYTPTDYPVTRAAQHYLAVEAYGTITASAKRQLEQLAKGQKANQLNYAEAMDLLAKTHFLDLTGKVVGPAITSTLSDTGNKEFEMATKKAAVAVEKKAPAKAAKPAEKKAAPVKAAKPTAEAAPVKVKKLGVTQYMMNCILEGMETDEIVMGIQEKFPESTAGKKEISWCRSKLRKEGKIA